MSITLPWSCQGNLAAIAWPAPTLMRAHRARELRQPRRVGVERLEEVPAALGLVLRVAGAQALGQRPPERVEAGVRHLQDATDVGGLGAVEEQLGRRGVGVAAVLALEHAERDQRVEEVRRAARMQAQAFAQRLAVERAGVGELGENRQTRQRSATSSSPRTRSRAAGSRPVSPAARGRRPRSLLRSLTHSLFSRTETAA